MSTTYQHDPDAAPDSEYEPGVVDFLAAGTRGRMLDPRRTPIVVVGLGDGIGFFEVEVTKFEDKGVRWSIPLEDVDHFQFERGSARLDNDQVAGLQELRDRVDRPLAIPVDPEVAQVTRRRLEELRARSREWFGSESRFAKGPGFDFASTIGREDLADDLSRFMGSLGLAGVEDAFAATYVSNPGSGDLVRGHEIVAARLGVCPYEGKALRDPTATAGMWSDDTRALHLLNRLAFVAEAYHLAGFEQVWLYRALAFQGPMEAPRRHSFISATFSRPVAEDLFCGGENVTTAVLYRQAVPIERLLMTYQETAAMNLRFHEAEALLLADPENRAF
jgi:hypothetical protein